VTLKSKLGSLKILEMTTFDRSHTSSYSSSIVYLWPHLRFGERDIGGKRDFFV